MISIAWIDAYVNSFYLLGELRRGDQAALFWGCGGVVNRIQLVSMGRRFESCHPQCRGFEPLRLNRVTVT